MLNENANERRESVPALQRFTSKKDLEQYTYLRFPRPTQPQKNREFITK